MKLPKGLIDHDGARLFGMKDIEAVVRDCVKVCLELRRKREEGYAYDTECADAILHRYGLPPAPDEEKRG